MLSSVENEKLEKFILTCSPEILYNNEADKKWEKMARFEKSFSAKEIIRLAKEGHLNKFNETDNFFRIIDNGDIISTSKVYYTDNDRNEYYKEHSGKFGYYLPTEYKKAIGWEPKEDEFKVPYTLYSVEHREGYYDKRKEAIKHRDIPELKILPTILYTRAQAEEFKAKNPICVFSKNAEKMGVLAPKYNHEVYGEYSIFYEAHDYIIKYHSRHQIFILLQYCEDHGIPVRNGIDNFPWWKSIWNTKFTGNGCFVCCVENYKSDKYQATIQYAPNSMEKEGDYFKIPADFLDFEMFDWSETEKHFEEKNSIKVGDKILVNGKEEVVSKVKFLTDGYTYSDGQSKEDEAHIVDSLEYSITSRFSNATVCYPMTVRYGEYAKL